MQGRYENIEKAISGNVKTPIAVCLSVIFEFLKMIIPQGIKKREEEFMDSKKMTFALAFANRGFMPGELIYDARKEMI